MTFLGTQSAALTMAAVKRRKRRLPVVHNTGESDVQLMSSDDYAASSADISSSSSSIEDNTDAVCRQHVVRKEMPSDHGSASVFWIPSLVPAIATVDSKDVCTNAHPQFSALNLHLGCCDVEFRNNMNEVADVSLQSDDAASPSEVDSPVIAAVLEQKLSASECSVSTTSPGELTQSHTLVFDTLASSQNWIPTASTVMSYPQDVLWMMEPDSDNTISSILSNEDRCVNNVKHDDFSADAAAHFRTELMPSSSTATEVSSHYSSSVCHERPGATSWDTMFYNCSSPESSTVQELKLSDNDGFCDEMQTERDFSNNDHDSAVLQFAKGHNQDSIYWSTFCQSADSVQDFHTSEDETDLTVSDGASMETMGVEDTFEKQNSHMCSDRQFDAGVEVVGKAEKTFLSSSEGSQNTEEQNIGNEDPSVQSSSNGFDEVMDGYDVCESNKADSNNVTNSVQHGFESFVDVGVDSDEEVVCATDHEALIENLVSVSDHRLDQDEQSVKSGYQCETADGDSGHSYLHAFQPTSHSISQPRSGVPQTDNGEDSSVSDGEQRRTTHSPEPIPVSAEARSSKQQSVEIAPQEQRNRSDETDPTETDNVCLNHLHWSPDESVCLSVSGRNSAVPVTESAVNEGLHHVAVVTQSTSSEAVRRLHAGPDEYQSETCELGFIAQHPVASCSEQERKLRNDTEQVSSSCVTSHNEPADSHTVTDGTSDLQHDTDMQENVTDFAQQICDQLKQELNVGQHYADELSDSADRDLLQLQGDKEVELSVVSLDEKVFVGKLPVYSRADAGTLCDSTQMENLPGSVENESSASHAEWCDDDWFSSVEADSVVLETDGDADMTVSLQQQHPVAEADDNRLPAECACVAVNESENVIPVHNELQTLHLIEVASREPEMVSKVVEGNCSDNSHVTEDEEELLIEHRQWIGVYQTPGSMSQNAPADVSISASLLEVEQNSRTVDLSLPVSEASNAREFEQQLPKNNGSYVSFSSEAVEENQISDSGTDLPVENSVQDEDSQLFIHTRMTEDVAAVTVCQEASSSDAVDVVNGESDAGSDLDSYLDVNLCERGVDHNVEIVSSYLEQFSEPCVSSKIDSFESGESFEGVRLHSTRDDKQPLFCSPASDTHTPGRSSVAADDLHDVLSSSNDRDTRELPKGGRLISLASESTSGGFLSDSCELDALYSNSGNISELCSVNAAFGSLSPCESVDSAEETTTNELKAVAALANYDSSMVIGSAVLGVAAVLVSPAMSLLGNFDHELHQEIAETGRESCIVDGLNTTVVVADSSVPDEDDGPAYRHHMSFGLDLIYRDQGKPVEEKAEESGDEIGTDNSMKAVNGFHTAALDSAVTDSESDIDNHIPVICVTDSNHRSPKTDEIVDTELNVGTGNLLDLSTAVVADTSGVAEPVDTLTDSMLRMVIRDKINEQDESGSKQECAGTATAFDDDDVREMIATIENNGTVVETTDDNGHGKTDEHKEFSVEEPDVPRSINVKQKSCGQLHANKEAVGTESKLTDAVEIKPLSVVNTRVADKPVDRCLANDCFHFSTQLEQQLYVAEGNLLDTTAESLLELVMPPQIAVSEIEVRLLPHDDVGARDHPLMLTDSGLSDIGVSGEEKLCEYGVMVDAATDVDHGDTQHLLSADVELSVGSQATASQFVAEATTDDFQAESVAECINTRQNDTELRIIPETLPQMAVANYQEVLLKPDDESQHEEPAAKCEAAGLFDGATADELLLRSPKLDVIVIGGGQPVSTVVFPTAMEGANFNAVTGDLDTESFVMLNVNGDVARHHPDTNSVIKTLTVTVDNEKHVTKEHQDMTVLPQGRSDVDYEGQNIATEDETATDACSAAAADEETVITTKSPQCLMGPIEVQQNHPILAVNDTLVTIVDDAAVPSDSTLSVHGEAESSETDARMVLVADATDDDTSMPTSMPEYTDIPAIADTIAGPVGSDIDSVFTSHGIISFVDSSQSEEPLAVTDGDSAAASAQVDSVDDGSCDDDGDDDDFTSSTVPSVTISMAPSVTVSELQRMLELLNDVKIKCGMVVHSDAVEQILASDESADTSLAVASSDTYGADTDFPAVAVNATLETTAVLSNTAPAAASVNFPMLQGKSDSAESVIASQSVSVSRTSDQMAAGRLAETDEYKSMNGQNAANSDVGLTETCVLLRLPSNDVTHKVGTSSIIDSTDSHSIISGTADRADIQDLVKNIIDVEADVRLCAAVDTKENGVIQPQQSLNDDRHASSHSAPSMVSSVVACDAYIASETPLISVGDGPKQPPGVDERSWDATNDSEVDHGTGRPGLRMEMLEADANIMSTSSEKTAVDGIGDHQCEHVPVVGSGGTGDVEQHSESCSTCKSETTGTIHVVNNVSAIFAAESKSSVADDGIDDENKFVNISELEPAQGNAVVAEQTEFSEAECSDLLCLLGDTEGQVVTLARDARHSSVAESKTGDKDTNRRNTDSFTKKLTVIDANEKHVTKEHQGMTVLPQGRPDVHSEGQNITAGDKTATDTCCAADDDENNLNIIAASTVEAVDATMKVSDLGQKFLQRSSAASACVSTAKPDTSSETADLAYNVPVSESPTLCRIELGSCDTQAYSAVDISVTALMDSLVDMPVDRTSKLQVLDSEAAVLSEESSVANAMSSTATEVANALQKKSDGDVFCDGRNSGPFGLNHAAGISVLLRDDLEVVDVTDKSEMSSATMIESISSLQAAVNYTGCHSVVAGTADAAVIQDLGKKISDIEADVVLYAAVDGKKSGVVRQQQSVNDGRPAGSQATPSVVLSTVQHISCIAGEVSETPLISVVDGPEQPTTADGRSVDEKWLNDDDTSICHQPRTVTALPADDYTVDEPEASDQNAGLYCHSSSLLLSEEAQASPEKTPSQTSSLNEIQLSESTDASLRQLSHTAMPADRMSELQVLDLETAALSYQSHVTNELSSAAIGVANALHSDVIAVTDQAFSFNENASLCPEIASTVTLLKEKDGDSEQMPRQNFHYVATDHMNGVATVSCCKLTDTANDTVLKMNQAVCSKSVDLSVAEESSIITTAPQKRKRSDEMAVEHSAEQKKPVVLQPPSVIASPEQQAVGNGVTGPVLDCSNTALLCLHEGVVTDQLLLESDDAMQHQRSAQVTAGDLQVQQPSDDRHATIHAFDTEVIREHQQTDDFSRPPVLHLMSVEDSSMCHHQQLPDETAVTIHGTVAAADDRKVTDEHVVSKLPVPTDDIDVVDRLSKITQQLIDYQCSQHKEPVINTDTFRIECHVPADVDGCVKVENVETNDLYIGTCTSGQFSPSTSCCYAHDDSNMPATEAGSICVVLASDIGVVQADTKLPASKDSRGLEFSAIISDVTSYQLSSLPEVLYNGTSRLEVITGEMDRVVDDTMVAACMQCSTAVSGEQQNANMLLIANQHQNHVSVGTPTNYTEFCSKNYDVDHTNREVSGFCEDSNEHSKDVSVDRDSTSKQSTVAPEALARDVGCLPTNNVIANMTHTSAEKLAIADTHKSGTCDSVDANIGDGTSGSHVGGIAHNNTSSVTSPCLNVCDMQTASMASSGGNGAGTVSASIMDWAEGLDQHAGGGCPYNCAETLLNVDVPVVADLEMMSESDRRIPVSYVESAHSDCDQFTTAAVARKLHDSECNSEWMSSQICPQQAVSHPHPTQNENLRMGSKQTPGDSTAVSHNTSTHAAWSAVCADTSPVQLKSVDGKVQNRRSSRTGKTVGELTDTEVLGIDLEPERPRYSLEYPSQHDVEIITSGHSTVGLGRRMDCEYHSIGLQPIGTQRPQFMPGPEHVLRDEVAKPYPESFWHSALDIEIRPRNSVDSQETSDERLTICPYATAAAAPSHDEAVMYDAASTHNAVTHREEQDSVVVTRRSCDGDLLRGMNAVTDRQTAGAWMTAGGASSVFMDSLAETLQGLSDRKPENCHITVNCESSHHDAASSYKFPASRHSAGRSQVYDLGLELFRSKSVDFADIQPDCRLVRSHSDMNIISARRSCSSHRRRHRPQHISANSSLSKSDQELLGSTSALFEDLLPIFRDLPLFSSLDGIDSDTEEDKFIGGEFGQFENFLPCYHDLPSTQRDDANKKRQEHVGDVPAVGIMRSGETLYDDGVRVHRHDVQDDTCGMPFRTTGNTEQFVTPTDEYKEHRIALKHDRNDDVAERTQSMDSITYVFVGHGASSLEAVGSNRSDMVRFLSEQATYPHEDAGNARRLGPVHSHACGVLTSSSSDSCLLSADTECPTPTRQSWSCADFNNQNADSSGICDDFALDTWKVGPYQMPAASYCLEFEHDDPGTQTSVGMLSERDALLPAFSHQMVIQTNESLSEGHAKQSSLPLLLVGRSQMEAEAQTAENHQLHQDDGRDIKRFISGSDGTDNVDGRVMHDNRPIITVSSRSGHVMQSDTVEMPATMAAGCQVNKPLRRKEQSNIVDCKEIPHLGDGREIRKSHTVQTHQLDDASPRTCSIQSLPYRTDDQCHFSAEHVLRSSSGRTIETQTYPEMRVIETQTLNDKKACATQTTHWSDVESGNQIAACINVPLAVSITASSPELHTSPISRPRTESSSPSAGVVTSQLRSAASSMPVIAMPCADLQSASSPVIRRVCSSFSDPSVTAVNNASAAVLHAGDMIDNWSGHPCEQALGTSVTTDMPPNHTPSHESGLLYERGTQTAQGGIIHSAHSPLPREGLPSSGSDPAGYRGPVPTVHSGTSINSTILSSTDWASDVHSTHAAVNDGLLLVDMSGKNLQHSDSAGYGFSSSDSCHQGRPADLPDVFHRQSGLSHSSPIQSMSNTFSPASNNDLEVIRTKDFLWNRSPEAENSKADKILEKYRMKNANRVLHSGNERSVSSPQYGNYPCLLQSAGCSQASSYSQANDSGIVGSQHSLSPLTRTLFGYSDVSCERSTVTEAGGRGTGWYDELERLRRERQRIIDLLAHEVVPSRIQVELTEAHLNYLIGQTDTLLQHADGPPVSQHYDVLGADFHAFCRTRLEASQRHIETQIQKLESIGKEARMKAAQLAAKFDSHEQGGDLADIRKNRTLENHYSTDSPVPCHYSRTWSPSQREQFLLGIRREIVSATASHPVPTVHSTNRLPSRSVRRLWPNRGRLSAHSSCLNLGPRHSMHEEKSEWGTSSLTATPAVSLQHLDRRQHSVLASSVDDEINSLLRECREARQRARVEIGRAMDVMQQTSPAWLSSSRGSHRYFYTTYIVQYS